MEICRLDAGLMVFTCVKRVRASSTSRFMSGPWNSFPANRPPGARVANAISSARSNSASERAWSTWRMPVVSGALMLMPAADFRAIGGFDEGYFLHVEDIDLCRRIGEAGGAVLFEPGAEALHFGSTSKASWAKVEGHKARGLVRYFNKFAASPGERFFIALLTPLIATAVMVRGFLRSLLRFRR